MYSQALDETEYSYQTLANDKWVAGQIEFCRRRQNLTWSHHEVVASLMSEEPEEALALLDTAEM